MRWIRSLCKEINWKKLRWFIACPSFSSGKNAHFQCLLMHSCAQNCPNGHATGMPNQYHLLQNSGNEMWKCGQIIKIITQISGCVKCNYLPLWSLWSNYFGESTGGFNKQWRQFFVILIEINFVCAHLLVIIKWENFERKHTVLSLKTVCSSFCY